MQTYPTEEQERLMREMADQLGVPYDEFLSRAYQDERERKRQHLLAKFQRAEDQIERGEATTINSDDEFDAFFEKVERQSDLDMQAGKPISDDVKPV